MDRDHILEEIRRTAEANNGQPLGAKRFEFETGIGHFDWFGRYWARWGEALTEAGYAPNELQGAFPTDFLLESYAQLAEELGRLPANSDLRVRATNDPDFPNEKVFYRLGKKADQVAAVGEYCKRQGKYPGVVKLCAAYKAKERHPHQSSRAAPVHGYVYLTKSGRYYKIGRTNSAGRRERELAIQLPEKPSTVHVIKTDDPEGIEAYWHKRFNGKRRHGEWFELKPEDVATFKRRKFM